MANKRNRRRAKAGAKTGKKFIRHTYTTQTQTNNTTIDLVIKLAKHEGSTVLSLTNYFLEEFPLEILELSNVRELYLSHNSFQSIPREISQLRELRILDLSQNRLLDLPDTLSDLKNLEELRLNQNLLTYVPNCISEMNNLRSLDIGYNRVKTIPESIGNLSKLENLNIDSNEVINIPSQIAELTNLRGLNIANNKISVLPEQLFELRHLQEFNLSNNLLELPPEIVNKASEPSRILAYYVANRGKQQPLNEVKTLVVGQGSVGKTSIVNRILYESYDQAETKTEGISIKQWQVEDRHQTSDINKNESKVSGLKSTIKLNIWDFGGQEIMHATHQFFLTKRSLYLLVLDARLTQEENRVEYWLKIIQSFGGESPVLIVGNKTEQHPLDIDRTGLQKKYPSIVGILETSAATGAGVESLKAKIAEQVNILPHVHDLLPERWFTVKSKLEELGKEKNFITHDEYLSLCNANHITGANNQHTLIGFLHDLGVILHFQDDPRLEALGILNPQWVTNGVYKILNAHELFQNQGKLTLPILNRILNLPEYPSSRRLFIVDIMKKFELCYDIELDKSFLIPDLLPKDEIYTGEWDDTLAFQYHYTVLPSSIISRFIVRMNAFIHKNTIWRSGVILKSNDNKALVKADTEDRKIYIWVKGKEDTRRDLLAMIRGEFDAIHKTIVKIEATEKVPLPNAPEAAPVDLSFLQRMASEGRESLPVQVGNRIFDLIVKEVLSQIDKENKYAGTIINIGRDVKDSTITIGNKNTITITKNTFKPIYRAIRKSSRKQTEKTELVDDVKEIETEVSKGDQVDESFLTTRLRNLKNSAPDIADVALAALTGPVAAVSTIVKKVTKKIKDETK